MRLNHRNQSGFTLIEMLIVIVVLGILAMIIVPQITVSTDDAKLSTLQTNLSGIRSALETYYAQHSNTYPGRKQTTSGNDGVDTGSDGVAATAFVDQLTKYTSSTGVVSNSKTGSYTYGPYIKGTGIPTNPFSNTRTVTCDESETNITVRVADAASAWKFYPETGVFIANDTSAHSAY